MRTGWLLASAALVLAVVTGCGDDAGTTASATPSPSSSEPSATVSDDASESPSEEPSKSEGPTPAPENMVACTAVWKDGARLPHGFVACQEKGYAVKTEQRGCSFGQRLVTYDDHFYAVRGGVIHRTPTVLARDRGYRSAMASCTA